ncbi:hypothetical protein DSL72_000007, partial [Monilinia vaccinii-corymbosi]
MNLMAVDDMVAEMTETEATAAVIVTTTMMLPVESIVTPDLVMVVIATAVEAMNAVEGDTKTVTDTTEVVVMIDQLETRLLLLPMVIKLLVEMLESHMEVVSDPLVKSYDLEERKKSKELWICDFHSCGCTS